MNAGAHGWGQADGQSSDGMHADNDVQGLEGETASQPQGSDDMNAGAHGWGQADATASQPQIPDDDDDDDEEDVLQVLMREMEEDEEEEHDDRIKDPDYEAKSDSGDEDPDYEAKSDSGDEGPDNAAKSDSGDEDPDNDAQSDSDEEDPDNDAESDSDEEDPDNDAESDSDDEMPRTSRKPKSKEQKHPPLRKRRKRTRKPKENPNVFPLIGNNHEEFDKCIKELLDTLMKEGGGKGNKPLMEWNKDNYLTLTSKDERDLYGYFDRLKKPCFKSMKVSNHSSLGCVNGRNCMSRKNELCKMEEGNGIAIGIFQCSEVTSPSYNSPCHKRACSTGFLCAFCALRSVFAYKTKEGAKGGIPQKAPKIQCWDCRKRDQNLIRDKQAIVRADKSAVLVIHIWMGLKGIVKLDKILKGWLKDNVIKCKMDNLWSISEFNRTWSSFVYLRSEDQIENVDFMIAPVGGELRGREEVCNQEMQKSVKEALIFLARMWSEEKNSDDDSLAKLLLMSSEELEDWLDLDQTLCHRKVLGGGFLYWLNLFGQDLKQFNITVPKKHGYNIYAKQPDDVKGICVLTEAQGASQEAAQRDTREAALVAPQGDQQGKKKIWQSVWDSTKLRKNPFLKGFMDKLKESMDDNTRIKLPIPSKCGLTTVSSKGNAPDASLRASKKAKKAKT